MRVNATTKDSYRVAPMFVVKKKTARRMDKPSLDH